MIKKIFENQLWHFLAIVGSLIILKVLSLNITDIFRGKVYILSCEVWFWIAVAIPIVHQIYVWVVWHLELYENYFSRYFGVKKAFIIYAVGFSILFVSRLISIIILAWVNRGSLSIEHFIGYALVIVIAPIVIYLFYSVKKYFTIKRAYGIDHFDKGYNVPYVKEGIFRFTDNGMYIFGLLILYIPGLLLFSKAALVIAIFNHLYIWVHYYCTELPDMKKIYGK